MVSGAASNRSVALVSLGCARNDVDGEELAAHLEREGWTVVTDPADAAVALINTCGFIEAAKKDSIDAVLEAAELKNGATTRAVVAVGLPSPAVRAGARPGAAGGGRRTGLRCVSRAVAAFGRRPAR
jgi:hypothetical protein